MSRKTAPLQSPRRNWLTVEQLFNLDHACRALVDAFGWCVYQVGSSLERRDWRDVDVRCILDDVDYERLFPGVSNPTVNDRRAEHALWALICVAISERLSSQTGLPVDFQIQKQSEANAQFQGQRSALGIGRFVTPT